jgi:hypothetical protein
MVKRTLMLGAAAVALWTTGCGTTCCKRPAPPPCGCPPGTGPAVVAPAVPGPPPAPPPAGFPPAAYYR